MWIDELNDREQRRVARRWLGWNRTMLGRLDWLDERTAADSPLRAGLDQDRARIVARIAMLEADDDK